MSDMWTYRGDLGADTATVTGFDVEARDGSIGKIDEATSEAGSSYLVVDTGFWIFGKKRMIPARTVERVDLNEEKVFLTLTKDQVKNAPDYDEERRHHDDYRSSVGGYYGGV